MEIRFYKREKKEFYKKMLDLNYVRENLVAVKKAMDTRGFPSELLDKFAALDAERWLAAKGVH